MQPSMHPTTLVGKSVSHNDGSISSSSASLSTSTYFAIAGGVIAAAAIAILLVYLYYRFIDKVYPDGEMAEKGKWLRNKVLPTDSLKKENANGKIVPFTEFDNVHVGKQDQIRSVIFSHEAEDLEQKVNDENKLPPSCEGQKCESYCDMDCSDNDSLEIAVNNGSARDDHLLAGYLQHLAEHDACDDISIHVHSDSDASDSVCSVESESDFEK